MPVYTRSLLLIFIAACSLRGGDAPPGADALRSGERLGWLRNWNAARPFYAEAERQFEAAGDRRNALFARISRLRGELDSRSYLQTSAHLADLLEQPLVQSDLALRLRCLAVKGDVDLELDTDLARRDWSEAKAVAEKLNELAWVNRANAELAITGFLAGDVKGAAISMAGAIQKANELNDQGSMVRYEALVGHGLVQWKLYEKALKFFDDALAIAQKNPDIQRPLLVYSGKIDALIALGRVAEAQKLLETAMDGARANSARGYEAELHLRAALLAWKRGERPQALTELNGAIQIADSIGAIRIAGQCSFQLAQYFEAAGNLPAASSAIRRTIASSRKAGDRLLLPAALAEAGRIEIALGRLQSADNYFEEAAAIANGIIASAPTITSKDQFIASLDNLYLDHFRLHVRRHDIAGAFRVLEEARGRAVADAVRSGSADARPSTARLTPNEKRVSQLQLALLRTTAKAERQRLLSSLERSEEELFPALVSPRGRGGATPTEPVALATLRSILPPGHVLVEYQLAEPWSHCLVITRDRAYSKQIPGVVELTRAVEKHLKAIEQRADFRESGRTLFEALLPTEARTAANLIVVPDGVLYGLPFETLIDAAGKTLIDKHTVWYEPSATVHYLLVRHHPQPPPTLPLLAVAAGVDGLGTPTGPVRRNLFDVRGASLPALPAANSEARLVGEAMGPQSVIITGRAATESAIKKQPLARYRVLHFAVHGLAAPDHPERAGLVFFPDEAAAEDGLWQLRDIARSKLSADLVTLSACRAGSGKVLGTAGTVSLVTAFLAAGARSVVANLWDSDDTFTKALMGSFYRHLARNMPAAEALRQAKLEMRARYGAEAPPYLWAGFTLTGINGPIHP
jgi:tetratricopeptide (TPR) repeat protein